MSSADKFSLPWVQLGSSFSPGPVENIKQLLCLSKQDGADLQEPSNQKGYSFIWQYP